MPSLLELQEFWEWCGWKWHDAEVNPKPGIKYRGSHWVSPDGEQYIWTGNPTLDLNNLFKYAVPKMIESGHDVDLFTEDGYYFGRIRETFAYKWHITTIGYLDPTEAIYQAIQKARHSAGKG